MPNKKKGNEEEIKTTPETCKNQETVKEEQQAMDPIAEENAQLKDKLLRTLAEYDNFRKRSIKEKEAIYPDAVSATVLAFLPVLDNFERAMASECADKDFLKGMEMIQKSFTDALQGLGVEEIPSLNEVFDPNLHSAVMHVEDDTLGENIICDVFQKGYRMGDKVIRFAMVKVAN